MKRLAALLLAAAGCVTVGPDKPQPPEPSPQEIAAKEAFLAWRDAMVQNRFRDGYDRMSSFMKTEWLVGLMKHTDETFVKEYRAGLTQEQRDQIDMARARWADPSADDLPPSLPDSLLNMESTVATLQDEAARQIQVIQRELDVTVIKVNYDNSNEATVQIRHASGMTEMYAMRPEGGGWKVHRYIDPPKTPPTR